MTIRAHDTPRREVQFIPGYDKRPKRLGDPNYGIHGMEIEFRLWGKRCVVYFRLCTDLMPETVEGSWDICNSPRDVRPFPVRVGLHSPVALYVNHEPTVAFCEFLNTQRCFGTHSGLDAGPLFKGFVGGGEEWLWDQLQGRADRADALIEQLLSDERNFS